MRKLTPGSLFPWLQLRPGLRRNPEAELESKEALRFYPQHQSAEFTLARRSSTQRKYKEAPPVIREAMAALPSMTALRKFLGIALIER